MGSPRQPKTLVVLVVLFINSSDCLSLPKVPTIATCSNCYGFNGNIASWRRSFAYHANTARCLQRYQRQQSTLFQIKRSGRDIDYYNGRSKKSVTTIVTQQCTRQQRSAVWILNGLPVQAVTSAVTASTIIHNNLGPLIISLRAIIALLGSVLCSIQLENWMNSKFRKSSSSSYTIVITMILSAIVASIGFAPKHPPLPIYDMCWTYFLPASLSFLLLSLNYNTSSSKKQSLESLSQRSTDSGENSRTILQVINNNFQAITSSSSITSIIRLAMPFFIACVGSILGCYITFHWFHIKLFPSPIQAAIAASCLVASFIGGSVKFMATASIIMISLRTQQSIATTDITSLLGAMSTVDILVMALYFFILSAAVQIKAFQRCFVRKSLDETTTNNFPTRDDDIDSTPRIIKAGGSSNSEGIIPETTLQTQTLKKPKWKQSVTAISIATFISMTLVLISRQLEQLVTRTWNIHGTSCGFLAILTPTVAKIISQQFARMKQQFVPWDTIQQSSELFSKISFLLLFSSFGLTANIDRSVFLGTGLSCLVFSVMALTIHCIFTFLGSVLYSNALSWITEVMTSSGSRPRNNELTSGSKNWNIEFNDVVIASNAAIGGPATAAAFCGSLPTTTTTNSLEEDERKQGLTLAATFWGVVGYAIGTSIGYSFYQFLSRNYILLPL